MGFGYLLIGYTVYTLMTLNKYGFAFLLLGCCLLTAAVRKLSEYTHFFGFMFFPLSIMWVDAIYRTYSGISDMFLLSLPLTGGVTVVVFDSLILASVFAFELIMLKSISIQADKVSLSSYTVRAKRNALVVILSALLQCAMLVVSGMGTKDTKIMTVLMACQLIFTVLSNILNIMLIFSCYMRICAPEDYDMDAKRSRIGFINKFFDKVDEKQNKAREENRKYYEEKLKKRKKKR